jgi:hypothetical protein
MDALDGKSLSTLKQWRCSNNKNHVLGVTERVKVTLEVKGRKLKYFTTRLLIFRHAVDLGEEIPAEIEVCGMLDGKTLNMTWKCSVPGCECVEEWHPDMDIDEHLAMTYLAE